ncbi:MAG: hypothetical protein N3E45_07765 [Oscillatoriaceae bacterium SKW80]|nr:hypothetical protein [Oscillatoriaceae bacterium SKYG93]MCX8120714.1 hypothetical protein [Oscillatoriaceae bacterium SKW80]MDW8453748.1 hypothetical protein [Oscillatoriaceae cyanobacterium SKYGB_i_bin93]HIK26979.1 hypothetical protein [Oscillatoriaceae cyanobacterium M7585_C2015_266]
MLLAKSSAFLGWRYNMLMHGFAFVRNCNSQEGFQALAELALLASQFLSPFDA